MHVPQIIIKKRDGGVLTAEEIQFIINGFVSGSIPDYQMASLLMAIYFKGMTDYELDSWTDAMINSGKVLNLKGLSGPKIDKHSTGGVGDKVSISLAPIVAACGINVPMISGRGLGHTGGTLDKLESMGINVHLDEESFMKTISRCGLVFAGQTEDICPADRKIYALRDVTGTVESIPLIASSIMSKKLAEGIDGLVLDIKVGRGAFMKDMKTAYLLARTMKRIGEGRGIKVKAVITAMDQPLGYACGNGVEAAEAIEMLMGKAPSDYNEVVLQLASWMLVLGGISTNLESARKMCEDKIRSQEALNRLRDVVIAQGGDGKVVDEPSRLTSAPYIQKIESQSDGWIQNVDAYLIGTACVALGAGRSRADEKVDHRAGIILHHKRGDRIEKGEALATLLCSSEERLYCGMKIASSAFKISTTEVSEQSKIILDEI